MWFRSECFEFCRPLKALQCWDGRSFGQFAQFWYEWVMRSTQPPLSRHVRQVGTIESDVTITRVWCDIYQCRRAMNAWMLAIGTVAQHQPRKWSPLLKALLFDVQRVSQRASVALILIDCSAFRKFSPLSLVASSSSARFKVEYWIITIEAIYLLCALFARAHSNAGWVAICRRRSNRLPRLERANAMRRLEFR